MFELRNGDIFGVAQRRSCTTATIYVYAYSMTTLDVLTVSMLPIRSQPLNGKRSKEVINMFGSLSRIHTYPIHLHFLILCTSARVTKILERSRDKKTYFCVLLHVDKPLCTRGTSCPSPQYPSQRTIESDRQIPYNI